MKLKNYKIDFGVDSFEVSLRDLTKKDIISTAILTLIVSVPFLILSILTFAAPSPVYFYSVLFFLIPLLAIACAVVGTLERRKRVKLFRFTVNNGGVRYKDIRADLYIPWERVVKWGFVNRNSISGTRSTPPYQTCLYFSTNVCEERYLRRRFDRIENKASGQCGKDLIVWGMKEDDIDANLMKNLADIISLYCDESTRLDSFVDEWGFH